MMFGITSMLKPIKQRTKHFALALTHPDPPVKQVLDYINGIYPDLIGCFKLQPSSRNKVTPNEMTIELN